MRTNVNHILAKLFCAFVFIYYGAATPVYGQIPVANFSASPLAGCSPMIINFQNLSTGNPTTWSWDFGNGNTSTLQNPVATYFTPGNYTVKLTATNLNGSNTLTRLQYISVYEGPTIGISSDKMSGCFPLKVQFSDLSSAGNGNTNVSWQWDFGNGTTSTLQNPAVTYTAAGIYNVTLKVTNDKGCTKTQSFTNYISVTTGVKAIFTNTQPTVSTPPVSISFTNNSTGPGALSYVWDFGDGSTSTLTNPTHIYNSNGSFIATLVANSNAGCSDTLQSSPIVIGGNSTSFTCQDINCLNNNIAFTNTSLPVPISSIWTFGDGATANSINSTHIYSSPGLYTVWLFNTYSGYVDSFSKTVIVVPGLVTNFIASSTGTCSPPLTVNFQDITPGAQSWLWIFGDGSSSTLQNPVHTYNTYGSFTDTLITTNSFGCSDTLIKPNYISIQKPDISIPSFPKEGCLPFTITPVATITSGGPILSYLWNFGDGGTSVLPNPTHTYVTQGSYDIKLITTTASGCNDTLIIPAAVKVGSKPILNFSAGITSACAHQQIQFTDLTAPVDEWKWNFGDGAYSDIQNPSHTFNDTGYFSVTLTAYNNGCADSLVKPNYIYILPPIAKFTPVPSCANRLQFSFTDESLAPLTWKWNFGDGSPNSSSQNPLHTFPALGTYNINLIVTNGSCSDTISQSVYTIDQSPDISVSGATTCRNTSLTFRALNINLSLTKKLSWDFGDGTQIDSTSDTIDHDYQNSGTYTVTLITTDINGCKDTITKNNIVRVNGPIANFSGANLSGCSGLTTVFNDLSTSDGINAITNWQWNFGDSTSQNSGIPAMQHIFSHLGTFSVQLKVTDITGCSDSITIANLVTTSDPAPDFVSSDTLSCPGASVNFTNTSTANNYTSIWDFGDGGASTNDSPTHAFAATGLYNVKLLIQDINGCLDSVKKDLYIRIDKPVANFNMNDSMSSCIPLEVQFTNTSTFYTSAIWDFGTGQSNSSLNDPIHYYTSPGNYQATLIVTSPGGCTDTITKNISLFDISLSGINYIPVNGCKPLMVNLTSFSPAPIASYFWDFGDGYTESTTTPNVNHLYASYGSFLPKVIMQDPSGCIIPVQGIDTIPVTGAKANFGFDKNLLCNSGTITFIDSTTFNDPVASYSWKFGDGTTSSQSNPVHQYDTPGIYDVSLIVQTISGCPDTFIKRSAIKIVQGPLIDIVGDSVICVNSKLAHSGIFLRADTSAVTWSWSFPNGNNSQQQNPVAQTYNTVGNFIIQSIATNSSGCQDSTIQNLTVNPLPTVTMPKQMVVPNSTSFNIPATYSSNTTDWLWKPSRGLSCTDCPSPDATAKIKTLYQVSFQDSNGCRNSGFVDVVVICSNSNLFIPNTFSPNGDGSNDVFYPRGTGLDRVKLLRVLNRWGEIVFEKRDFQVNDPLSGWNGMYKGLKAKADVYIYQAEIFCENGELITLNGNIALIL